MRVGSKKGVQQLMTQLHFHLSEKQRVSVIGLGQMGVHMAGNLSKQFEVYGVDTDIVGTQKRIQTLGYSGIQIVDNIQQLPTCKQYVLSLPNNQAVEQVVQLLCQKVERESIVIDTSTISPQLARQCNKQLQEKNNSMYVDAPVSGGVVGSEKATLTFMLGMSSQHSAIHLLHPLLTLMGTKQVYCGSPGKGQSIKLVNNLALAIQMLSICETFAAGQLLGIDPQLQLEVFSTSTSRCWSVDTYVPVAGLLENVPANRQYAGGFSVDLLLKDLALVIQEIQMAMGDSGQLAYSQQFSITQEVFNRYHRLSKQYGLGDKDFGVMFQAITQRMQ